MTSNNYLNPLLMAVFSGIRPSAIMGVVCIIETVILYAVSPPTPVDRFGPLGLDPGYFLVLRIGTEVLGIILATLIGCFFRQYATQMIYALVDTAELRRRFITNMVCPLFGRRAFVLLTPLRRTTRFERRSPASSVSPRWP